MVYKMSQNNITQQIKGRFLTGKAVITALDQGVLSVVNFLIGIVFIYYSTPEKYGTFTFFMSFFYLFSNIQNALINTPMIVLSPRMSIGDSKKFRKGLFVILIFYLVIVNISVNSVVLFNKNLISFIEVFIISTSICFLLLRDYFRTEEFAQLNPKAALFRDICYSVISFITIFFIVMYKKVEVSNVFLIIGVSSLVISIPKLLVFLKEFPSKDDIKRSMQKSWIHSRWSLFGASASWLQGNAYIYIPFLLLGAKEVAFLSASRLLMTPMTLIITSYGNILRPLISRVLTNDKKSNQSVKIIVTSIYILLLLLFIYTSVIVLVLKYFPIDILPKDYHGLEKFVLVWALLYFVRIIRTNLSNYMQASLSFKPLAYIGVSVAVVTLILTIGIVWFYGIDGTLIGLILGEIMFVILLKKQLQKLNN